MFHCFVLSLSAPSQTVTFLGQFPATEPVFGAFTLSHFLVTVLFTCCQSNFDRVKIFSGYSVLSTSLIPHRAGIWDLPPHGLQHCCGAALYFGCYEKAGEILPA